MTIREFLKSPIIIAPVVVALIWLIFVYAVTTTPRKILDYHDDKRHVTCWRIEDHQGISCLPDRAFEEDSSTKSVDKP